MRAYSYIGEIRKFILKKDWSGLETSYFNIASQLADKETALMISNFDLTEYSFQLFEAYKKSLQLADTPKSKAIYFEYDMDNNWSSNFYLCSEYQSEKEGDDDWACTWKNFVEGPVNSGFCVLYGINGFDGDPRAVGITAYLVARTVAAFGKVVHSLTLPSIPICIGYHDQHIAFRINEVLWEVKSEKSSGYYLIDTIVSEGMGIAYCPKELIFDRLLKSNPWQPCTFEIEDGYPTDLLHTDTEYSFISPQLKDCISRQSLPGDKIRWLNVFARTTKGEALPYYIIDFDEGIDALNISQTRFHVGTYTGNPCLHENIIKQYHVFTIRYPEGYSGRNGVIVSASIKDEIEKGEFTGIKFNKIKSV